MSSHSDFGEILKIQATMATCIYFVDYIYGFQTCTSAHSFHSQFEMKLFERWVSRQHDINKSEYLPEEAAN